VSRVARALEAVSARPLRAGMDVRQITGSVPHVGQVGPVPPPGESDLMPLLTWPGNTDREGVSRLRYLPYGEATPYVRPRSPGGVAPNDPRTGRPSVTQADVPVGS